MTNTKFTFITLYVDRCLVCFQIFTISTEMFLYNLHGMKYLQLGM